jgi:uncharacterized membrane protein
MKAIWIAIIAILILAFSLTFAAYPLMPKTIVTHWDAAGNPNGSMQALWGILIVPLIMVGMTVLFAVIPRIDPLRKNYGTFLNYYEGFVLFILAFMLVIQIQVLLWNTGYMLNPNLLLPILTGLLFIYIGFLIEKAEQNWFVGIRTPWTLSSVTVWKKTHDLGGNLFKVAGVISCAGILFQEYAIWFVLVPVLVVSVYSVAYSYVEYQKEGHPKTDGSED